jgi:hypothetical protein
MKNPNPIIALWAHPRSMSTAVERVMRERGDLTVFHEPFMADYYTHRAERLFPMVDTSGPEWVSYPVARDRILAAAEDRPVFFKDISYYVTARLPHDPEFARRLTHVFLVRDPRRSIASYWKLDPDMTFEEIGIKASWDLHQAVSAMGAKPLVVEAEAIVADPQGQIGRIWAMAGLNFAHHAFGWKAGQMPDAWGHVAGWHGKAVGSTGIEADVSDPEAAFDTAAERAPYLRDLLARHWPFYERLRALAA